MSTNPSLTYDDGGGTCPHSIQLAPTQDVRPQTIAVAWDGASATGSFLACLSLYSQSGVLIARTCPPVTFAVGDTGVVTYAPFLGREPEAPTPGVVGTPPFTVLQLDGTLNVYVMTPTDPAGTPTAITDNTDGGATYDDANNPVLSPDGTMIAFMMTKTSTGFPSLWVVANAAGSTPTELVADSSNYILHPMWSPDSATIVYTRGISGALRGAVESVPASGGSPTVLYTPAAGDGAFRPAFNFDGSLIAFVLDKNIGAGQGIVVMNADGSGPSQIVTVNAYRFDGSQFGWANAQDTLAYDDGASSCYVVNADGTGQTLVNTGGLAGVPVRCSKTAWASDDSHIVVTSNDGSKWALYRLELDGSGETLLNASHGAYNQQWMKQAFLHDGRLYFIELASGGNGGKIGSVLVDGTDYRLDLNLLAGSVGDWFYGGTAFEWQ